MKKNDKCDLSIITTFHNTERYILDCIKSINAQTFNNIDWEYIIVDDCSEDKSRSIVEEYIKDNVQDKSRWKIITPEYNLGCGGARKLGIESSKGKYLMFLDADDYYINYDFCLRAYNTIKEEKCDIVEYGVKYNLPNGDYKVLTIPQKTTYSSKEALMDLFLFNNVKFSVWAKIINRRLVKKFPYSETRTFEDIRTIPYWLFYANKIVVMPSSEINYRASDNSIIRNDDLEARYGTLLAFSDILDTFKDDTELVKAMYRRALIDLKVILLNHSSDDKYFNEVSVINTKFLSYIYPDTYKQITYNIENN